MPRQKPELAEPTLDAATFVKRLHEKQSDEELRKIGRYFKSGEGQYGAGDRFIGVRMGEVFALAKEFIAMPPAEIERLMESDTHEARAGALRLMADQYRLKTTTAERRKELYELYLRRHDRINNWDLVDLAAWHVVGPHLVDQPRDVLHQMAKSDNMWERRTAILATYSFIKRGQLDDTFRIVALLIGDSEDLIHKACGTMLRAVGAKHRPELEAFLGTHASTMPRTMLRYAIEHFSPEDRAVWMDKGKR